MPHFAAQPSSNCENQLPRVIRLNSGKQKPLPIALAQRILLNSAEYKKDYKILLRFHMTVGEF